MSRSFAVTGALLAAGSAPAAADTFKLFAEADGGGMAGTGTQGDQKANAFFKNAPHGMYGFELGAELVFLDAWIEHHQYTDGSRVATWTQFGLGMHYELDFAQDPPPPDDPTKHSTAASQGATPKKATKPDRHGGFAEFSGGVWYGLGTGQQVSPPLDNSQITDKALIGEGRVGIGKHVGNLIDFGIQVPVSYGYFIKNGNGAVANNLSTHYRGVQVEALLYLRFNLRLL